jgi:hypothetical protein
MITLNTQILVFSICPVNEVPKVPKGSFARVLKKGKLNAPIR